ncbi:2OG-Fe(II) oxygenase [Acanthopleuribacter pedis]|uniref:2OG-Fe(II) oxygenase n=1 Tax=Acanthopleuribacter pedis TaxID=442870 RepID=A0A8J7QGM6_9BACT|nr:2OG-Fe(II) oxygenase [Acanthopleuribacter pedis]MBO1319760.1 2OG-Fe(II) oxygenase [Acanthopleuribacter pedis]
MHLFFDLIPGLSVTCRVFPGLFSPRECRDLIALASGTGFADPSRDYPPSYRNNDRLVRDDPGLADTLFHRLREPLIASGVPELGAGAWVGLNPRFRFCRYRKGQFFSRHRDGAYRPSSGTASKLTFMLYLNDGEAFTGGHTDFYEGPGLDARRLASYRPECGSLIVFDHTLWHEGSPVHEGEKYIMRSDFLIREAGNPSCTPDHPPAHDLYRGHRGYIWALQALVDGALASGSRDRTIRIWAPSGKTRQTLRGHQLSVLALAAPRPGVLVSGSRDRTVKVWVNGDKGFQCERTSRIHQAAVISLVSLQPDTYASADAAGRIAVHRLGGGTPRIMDAGSWVWGLACLSPDRLASVSEDGTLIIWEWAQGRRVLTRRFPYRLNSVAFAPNCLILGDSNGSIHGFINEPECDRLNARPEWSFSIHRGAVRCLFALPSGGTMSGGEDGVLRVTKRMGPVPAGKMAHLDFVTSVAQLRDGSFVSGSYDGTIQRWDATSWARGSNELDTALSDRFPRMSGVL